MNLPPWEAVLFDYGGTLDGDGIHWSVRFDRVFRGLGLEYPAAALERAFRASEEEMNGDPAVAALGLKETLRLQITRMLPWLDLEDIRVERREREETGVIETAADPAAVALIDEATRRLLAETRDYLSRNAAVLRALEGRAKTGIISNFTGNLQIILAQEGIAQWIGGVFDSAVVGLRKPDPEFFLHALRALGARPERSVMVGDSVEMDLKPARGLGMGTVWVEGEAHRKTDFDPDFRLQSVRGFLNLWGAAC